MATRLPEWKARTITHAIPITNHQSPEQGQWQCLIGGDCHPVCCDGAIGLKTVDVKAVKLQDPVREYTIDEDSVHHACSLFVHHVLQLK